MAINVNTQHSESLNMLEKIGLKITRAVGSMYCAIIFSILALISLPAAIQTGSVVIIVGWIAQTFLQLVLLSIILVGQDLQSRHSELRAENDFQVNLKAEQEIEVIQEKLDIAINTLNKLTETVNKLLAQRKL